MKQGSVTAAAGFHRKTCKLMNNQSILFQNHFKHQCFVFQCGGRQCVRDDALPTIFDPHEITISEESHSAAKYARLEHDYGVPIGTKEPTIVPHPLLSLSSQVEEEEEDVVFLDQSGVLESAELEISQLDPVIHDLEQRNDNLVAKNTALETKLADQNKDLRDQLEALKSDNKTLEARMAKMTALQASVDKIFHDDQVKCLTRGHMRGSKWSVDTIKKSLQLRFSCGKTGYMTLIEAGYPLPSIRTLQKRTEDFNFEPGILDDVIDFMVAKIKGFKNKNEFVAWQWMKWASRPDWTMTRKVMPSLVMSLYHQNLKKKLPKL
jgi:hypothetical protein